MMLYKMIKKFSPSVSLVELNAYAADYFEKMSEDIFLFEGERKIWI